MRHLVDISVTTTLRLSFIGTLNGGILGLPPGGGVEYDVEDRVE